jgi:carbon starvation protein CstA
MRRLDLAVAGVCLAGAVQDFIWLWASTRRGGRSLGDIARTEVGTSPASGGRSPSSSFLIIAMAGLGIVVVNALAESAWAHVHDLHHDPARAGHGLLHVPLAHAASQGSDHRRRRVLVWR